VSARQPPRASRANVNAENVIVTRDASLVRAFTVEFESLWGRYATRP
jgi:hypothetical protein